MISKPKVGEIWRFTGLGREFYYIILEVDESSDCDIILGSFNEFEPTNLREYSDSFKRKNKWTKL